MTGHSIAPAGGAGWAGPHVARVHPDLYKSPRRRRPAMRGCRARYNLLRGCLPRMDTIDASPRDNVGHARVLSDGKRIMNGRWKPALVLRLPNAALTGLAWVMLTLSPG